MRLNHGIFALMLSATALASAAATTACAGGGVVYDPYRHDYHRWNRGEDRLYRRWEVQGHRGHLDFQRRSAGEQSAYWGWRHK
ncbi:MAG: hypothetical protein QOH59_691 [Gemmatimonadales bacterium]|jgi:hypothetical protein|nr:hypothetical protein [Gemmatimonadales bacterium]